MKVFLDIETIPSQRADVVAEIAYRHVEEAEKAIAALKAPSNYGAEASAGWMATKAPRLAEEMRAAAIAAADEEHRKQSLDGAFGELVVISFAVDDGAPVTFFRDDVVRGGTTDEAALLHAFSKALERAIEDARDVEVIGHNVEAFDKPFLRQRALVCGVSLPGCVTRSLEPWKATGDTMLLWSQKKFISLDTLCRVFRLPGKGDGLDGSKVWDAVREGRIDEVAAYCAADVERARAVYNRMTLKVAA